MKTHTQLDSFHVLQKIATSLCDDMLVSKVSTTKAAEIAKTVLLTISEYAKDEELFAHLDELVAKFPELAQVKYEIHAMKDEFEKNQLIDNLRLAMDKERLKLSSQVSA